MTRRLWLVALAGLLAVACGPPERFEVSTREFPVDILIGEGEPTPPPLPPVRQDPAVVGFPGFIEPPMPRLEPGVPPPPPEEPAAACPAAHPFDAARIAAGVRVHAPPVVADHTFRNNGYVEIAGASRVDYPAQSRRSVTEVRPMSGQDNWDFDVEAELARQTTTTTYRIVNDGSTPDRGLYLVRTRSNGQVFTPQPPILLMPFPSEDIGLGIQDEIDFLTGRNYASAGSDPTTGTTMALEAYVEGKERVDACGEWVDAWQIVVEVGRITGPAQDLSFTGTFNVATQYGGLIVADDLHLTGRDGLDEIESRNRALINDVPPEG